MPEIGTATVKVSLDWTGVADYLRAMADRIDAPSAPTTSTDTRTIPWPPPDELVEKVADAIRENLGRTFPTVARAVLDVIGADHA